MNVILLPYMQLTNAIQGKRKPTRPPLLRLLPSAADTEENEHQVQFYVSDQA